jgi:hypothetical protein
VNIRDIIAAMMLRRNPHAKQRMDRSGIRKGAAPSLKRIYRWFEKGPVVTVAGGRQYIKTARGPWVRKDKYDAINASYKPEDSNAWIREGGVL